MLKENDAIRKLLNVDVWHKAGYTGKGTTLVILDSSKGKPRKGMECYYTDVFGTATESGHSSNVGQIAHEFAFEGKILYFDNTRNQDAVFLVVEKLAIEGKVDVINVSLAGLYGAETPNYLRYKELCEKYNITMVCAVGNDYYENRISYPAAYDFTIAVGSASAKTLKVSSFSNKGMEIDIASPSGVSIINSEGVIWQPSGTSYTSPITAALLLIYNQYLKENGLVTLKPEESRKLLRENSRDIEEEGFDIKTGHGLSCLPATIPVIAPEVVGPEKEAAPPTEAKKLFRVLSKPYLDQDEAQAKADELKAKGIATYLVHSLQFGAFGVEQNAGNQQKKLLEEEDVVTYVAQY